MTLGALTNVETVSTSFPPICPMAPGYKPTVVRNGGTAVTWVPWAPRLQPQHIYAVCAYWAQSLRLARKQAGSLKKALLRAVSIKGKQFQHESKKSSVGKLVSFPRHPPLSLGPRQTESDTVPALMGSAPTEWIRMVKATRNTAHCTKQRERRPLPGSGCPI